MLGPILAASIRTGFETLTINPLRTLLSTLGIIMGVGALVSVLSLGDGMEQLVRSQIDQTTDLHTITASPSLFRTVDGYRFAREDAIQFSRADADALQRAVGTRGTVILLVSGQALVTTVADTTPTAAQVNGTTASVAGQLPKPLAHGRLFTEAEVERGAPVAVLSAALADRISRGRSAAAVVGDTLFLQGAPFTVIGILAAEENRRQAMALIPISTARSALPPAQVGPPTTVVARANRVEDVPAIRSALEDSFRSSYGPSWSARLSVATNEARVVQAQRGLLAFKVFMGALTGISLLVGGVGIMNVLLASVVERTREIGIRKAAGAQQRHILLQFLFESVAVTSAGSVVGLVLGVGVAFGATAVMRRLTQAEVHAGFSASTFFIAVGASVFVGVLFGLYPALRAARLSPIDAIHHE